MAHANTANERRKPTSAGARVGRPPSVSAPAIIQAAIAIGLEHFTLKQVADRLHVAVATLYRHVSSRDELVRLAAFQLSLNRQLADRSSGAERHWSDVARAYAVSLFDSLRAEPQLLHELVNGRLGPEAGLDFLEPFLADLRRHGFTAAEGIRVHHAVAMLAIGAAASMVARSAGRARSPSHAEAMQQALAQRDGSALPEVRAALPEYLDSHPKQWLQALDELLHGIAAGRGESLAATLAGVGQPLLRFHHPGATAAAAFPKPNYFNGASP